jgi:RNA polymerase sigma-70 factor (ECF subfamily)
VTPISAQARTEQGLDNAGLRDLVDQARNGDSDAWVVLYKRAYPSLLGFAAARLGRLEAEDAVSETMTRAVRNISKFEWKGVDFTGWLFGIHRHVVADAQRARGRRSLAPVPDGDSDRDDSQPIDGLLRHEEHSRVRVVFDRLNSKDQELLHLRVIAGMSVEEVAGVLGKRPGAVRVAQSRALGRLRKLMEHAES